MPGPGWPDGCGYGAGAPCGGGPACAGVAGAAAVNCEVVAGNQHGGSEKWNPLDVIPVGMAQQQVGFAAAPGEVALAQRASQPVQPHTAIQDQELPVGGDYFDTGGIAPIAFITRVWCGR